MSIALSQDDSRIVSGSEDTTICVWEAPQSNSLNIVSSDTVSDWLSHIGVAVFTLRSHNSPVSESSRAWWSTDALIFH